MRNPCRVTTVRDVYGGMWEVSTTPDLVSTVAFNLWDYRQVDFGSASHSAAVWHMMSDNFTDVYHPYRRVYL